MAKPEDPIQRSVLPIPDITPMGLTTFDAKDPDTKYPPIRPIFLPAGPGGKYRADAHWDFALQLEADNPTDLWNLLDERASWFYEAVGAGPAMAPKRPGPSSAY